jgi:predicted dinucleotide-binding enzyme
MEITMSDIQLGMEGLLKGLQVGYTTSGAEEVAQWAQGAKVVKAFNNIGANCYEDPQFGPVKATAFICGNDAEAKHVTTTLAQEIGFEVVDVGPLTKARLLEPLGMLWIDLAISGVGREFAISLVKR